MNRRSFLGALGAFIGAAALAKVVSAEEPERELQTGAWDAAEDSWGSGCTALKRGDILTITGVYSVNPLSYRVTERLQQFVVTRDVTAGDRTVTVSPAVITAGQLQTVECQGRWKPSAGQTVKLSFSPRPMPGTDQVPLSVVDAWVPSLPSQRFANYSVQRFRVSA